MTLQLDERQRAMLAEMGLKLFLAPVRAEVREEARPPVSTRAASEVPAPVAKPPEVMPAHSPAIGISGVADADWDALAQIVNQMADGSGHRAVPGSGDARAEWLVVGDPIGAEDEAAGEPFAGEAGALLNNMLKAVGVSRAKAYVTSIMKCRPSGNGVPDREALEKWEQVLRREVELVRPKVMLVMGRFAVPTVLRTSDPIGRLRGTAHDYCGVPVVVTYHPTYLLRDHLEDKARVWADLCLAMQLVRGQAG